MCDIVFNMMMMMMMMMMMHDDDDDDDDDDESILVILMMMMMMMMMTFMQSMLQIWYRSMTTIISNYCIHGCIPAVQRNTYEATLLSS